MREIYEAALGASPTIPKGTAIHKTVQQIRGGEAETPVQQPGSGVTVQTAGLPNTTAQQTAVRTAGYTNLNRQIWGEGGGGLDAYNEMLKEQTRYQNQTGAGSNPYTDAELSQLLAAAGIDPSGMGSYSQKGGYIQTGGSGTLPGTGEEGWNYQSGAARPVADGTAGADEEFLSDAAYAYIQYCRQQYAAAQTPEDKSYWHTEAERTRARAGYSGGADGSMYIPLSQLGIQQQSSSDLLSRYPGSSEYNSSSGDLKSLLDAWKQAAIDQSNGQIDYALLQAVNELERVLADSETQFKEQAESVSRDERQGMDNAALYAELRGDKGGIGQEQYNSIQNTAAQNRLAIQQAQTKLTTDTQRQIADLRAQGEFEKADAALEITQNYLAQLMSIEQWAAEYNLTVEQFNAQLAQWESEYQMSLQQIGIAQNQWQAEFDFAQQQYADSLAANDRSEAANIAWSLLQAGVEPDAEQLASLGISKEQASQLLLQAQLGQSSGAAAGGGESVLIYQQLANSGATDYGTAYAMLLQAGYNTTAAKEMANYYADTWLPNQTQKQSASGDSDQQYASGFLDWDYIKKLGIGMPTSEQIVKMLDDGALTLLDDSSLIWQVVWAPGWNWDRYRRYLTENP